MAPRPPVHAELTWHRAAAVESEALMRETNADIRSIIEKTRIVIEDSHEAMRRADALLVEATSLKP